MIGLIGLDHHRASAELRGRVSFAGEQLLAAVRALVSTPAIDEAVILSTCNRTEVYVATLDWPAAAAASRRLLHRAFVGESMPAPTIASVNAAHDTTFQSAERQGFPLPSDAEPTTLPAELERALYHFEGTKAAQHVLEVSAGLQSMVVGEAQILGQVKEALAASEAVHAVGDELRTLFTVAIKVGKRARAETQIGRADVSVAALAVQVAAEAVGGLAGKSALLIGAGRTSRLCAEHLRAGGITRLILANRTSQTAAALAQEVQGDAMDLAMLADVIPTVHLIVSATAAPHAVLDAATVAHALAGRHTPLVIVDLAVPPDVEDAVGMLPLVSLYTLDTLHTLDAVTAQAPVHRQAEVAHINTIVDDGLRELMRTRALRLAVPGIAALRRHVDRSEQLELDAALAQLEHLSPADRAVIERFGQRLVDKMFHHLVSRIRSLAEYDEVPPDVTMQVLARLFADPEQRR